uniref:CRAL-TRIO lipid binding domain-containing protein n=1 Tax=Tanacetum cinerariifolium TaxID=118510 RepID=A0A699I2I0_TANCI|nr:CRAL-TRIO lipid binding domain-containing protein [Tanacetum cinerariifolium]
MQVGYSTYGFLILQQWFILPWYLILCLICQVLSKPLVFLAVATGLFDEPVSAKEKLSGPGSALALKGQAYFVKAVGM